LPGDEGCFDIVLPIAILAGGLATRLGPLTTERPKALIQILDRPFVEWQLNLLSSQGLRKVIFCVGHLGSQIEDIVGDGSKFNLNITYSYDGPTLLGTGGAIKRALDLLGEKFLVTYGDSYLPMDLQSVEKTYRESKKPSLMAVYKNNNAWDRSNVRFEDGLVTKYAKDGSTDGLQYIDFGLQAFKREIFDEYPHDRPFDLGIVLAELADKEKLAGYEAKSRFFEVGSLAGIQDLENYLDDRSGIELL
jgi:MurNAc alpha-1-phosphate uridylyltransferase